MWISLSLSVAAVAECRLEPGGPASLFMWSKQCGHCGRGGRGTAASGWSCIKQDFLKLSPVQKPQPEHTKQDCQSNSCSRCVPVVQDKARGTNICGNVINRKCLLVLNRICRINKLSVLFLVDFAIFFNNIATWVTYWDRQTHLDSQRHTHTFGPSSKHWALDLMAERYASIQYSSSQRNTHRCWNK